MSQATWFRSFQNNMLQKIPIDKTRYIIFDDAENTAKVVVPQLVSETLAKAQAKLNSIPAAPSDEDLLAFARAHYPAMDYSAEKASLQKTIEECTNLLGAK